MEIFVWAMVALIITLVGHFSYMAGENEGLQKGKQESAEACLQDPMPAWWTRELRFAKFKKSIQTLKKEKVKQYGNQEI